MGAAGKLQDPSINRRPALLLTAVTLFFELGIAVFGFSRVPLGARVPVHWNAMGNPNGYGEALWAFLLIPGLTFLISVVFALLPAIEPRRRNLLRSGRAYLAVWVSFLLLLAFVQAALVLPATGVAQAEVMARLVPAAVGLLLAVIGNYLGKVRSNFFFGIRTPWTLSSERSWNRTHRLGGRLFVLVGLAAAATCFFPWISFVVLLGGVAALIVILPVYSFLEWRRDPAVQGLPI
jgi:uncharacterized membrane protein